MFYDCGALAREARSNANRQREIEALMIKAESGAGGGLSAARFTGRNTFSCAA